MIAFAYTECGLSIEQFFKLSWYEWSLEIEKVRIRKQRDFDMWEGNGVLARKIMATILNSAGKLYKKHIDEKELLKLSIDDIQKETVTAKPMTPEEVERKFGKTLTDKINYG